MKMFVESLSFGSGAMLVAIISALLAGALSFVRSPIIRWLGAITVPFIISYCLYWLPVWLGSNSDQYYSWEILGVGVWFLAGVIPSALLVLLVQRFAKSRIKT